MSVTVERGSARCPRCMALADYRFHEGDGGQLSYEVSCGKCGNTYREVCASPSAAAPAA
jgi:hypothetical protein